MIITGYDAADSEILIHVSLFCKKWVNGNRQTHDLSDDSFTFCNMTAVMADTGSSSLPSSSACVRKETETTLDLIVITDWSKTLCPVLFGAWVQ